MGSVSNRPLWGSRREYHPSSYETSSRAGERRAVGGQPVATSRARAAVKGEPVRGHAGGRSRRGDGRRARRSRRAQWFHPARVWSGASILLDADSRNTSAAIWMQWAFSQMRRAASSTRSSWGSTRFERTALATGLTQDLWRTFLPRSLPVASPGVGYTPESDESSRLSNG